MKNQRIDNILSIIKSNGYSATIELIASKLNVSPSTIRRDLKVLEEQKLIKRSYGKADCLEDPSDLLPFPIRFHTNVAEKMTVCRLASSLVHEGDVVFLDASSTAYCMTRFLREIPNVKIITNGIENINSLIREKNEVYSTGGKLSNDNRIAFVGKRAIDFVLSMHADVLFCSAFSISPNGQVYDICDEEIAVRQAMLKNSDKKVLIIDDKKLGKTAPFLLANVNDFDYVVCNKDISNFFDPQINANLIFEANASGH